MTIIAASDVDGYATESSLTAKLLQPISDQWDLSILFVESTALNRNQFEDRKLRNEMASQKGIKV